MARAAVSKTVGCRFESGHPCYKMAEKKVKLPTVGIPKDELLNIMRNFKEEDAKWKEGKTWSLVYHASQEHTEFLKSAYNLFFSENALNPIAFPSLKKFEAEVISMAVHLLGGDDDASGTMTSGGTESILMAIKTYRDRAKEINPQIKKPEMILPITVHPAFEKASHYFEVRPVHIPVDKEFRADVSYVKKNINENTILIVGSAPSYPYGAIDPISDMASIAKENNLGFHVDACLGGFLLPFVKKLGYPITDFDFKVDGVTSISADIHKYGFAAKGASVVLYRTKELRDYQFYIYTDWPGGIYASPSMAGTRPGGAIAAAWGALMALGEDGYLKIADEIMKTTKKLIDGINNIPGLYILGRPDMSVFAFTSDKVDIFALGDIMDKKGWRLDRQQNPNSLHLMVTPVHTNIVPDFLLDLKSSVEHLVANPSLAEEGMAPFYGMMASVPDRGMVRDFVLQFLDGLYEV